MFGRTKGSNLGLGWDIKTHFNELNVLAVGKALKATIRR